MAELSNKDKFIMKIGKDKKLQKEVAKLFSLSKDKQIEKLKELSKKAGCPLTEEELNAWTSNPFRR